MIYKKDVIEHKSKEQVYLELVKNQEKEKKSLGFIWVKKGKTTKHVSPTSLIQLLDDGWVRCS